MEAAREKMVTLEALLSTSSKEYNDLKTAVAKVKTVEIDLTVEVKYFSVLYLCGSWSMLQSWIGYFSIVPSHVSSFILSVLVGARVCGAEGMHQDGQALEPGGRRGAQGARGRAEGVPGRG